MTGAATTRLKTLWAIRDAGDALDWAEWTFLVAVESRGAMTRSASGAASDMRMGRTRFYKTRERLLARGLISAQPRAGTTTEYRVDHDAVTRLGIQGVSSDGTPTPLAPCHQTAEGAAATQQTPPGDERGGDEGVPSGDSGVCHETTGGPAGWRQEGVLSGGTRRGTDKSYLEEEHEGDSQPSRPRLLRFPDREGTFTTEDADEVKEAPASDTRYGRRRPPGEPIPRRRRRV